ncbi:MAG: DUF429 domain-containing protein [Fimbriimonadales bacterium]|nr:DUF429 domain-containing protein [Fimbriimonadales bacterium]
MAEDPGGGPALSGPFVGVDGCRGGWLCAWRERGRWRFSAFMSPRDVLSAFPETAALAFDMPIGLADEGFRACDLLARALLRPHGSRVFLAPPRPCLQARDPTEFQGLHRRLTGKGAGVPVWRILPAIRELDLSLRPEDHRRAFEAHPELAFAGLAGGPAPSKHTPEGRGLRLRLLRAEPRDLPCGWTDDHLDAMVLSLVAGRFAEGAARTLPAEPPTDATGKPMRIVLPNEP